MSAYSAAQLVIAAMLAGATGGAIGAVVTLYFIESAMSKIAKEST